MTDLFNRCIDVILSNEGGYVDDPNDSGGETNYGISKQSYPLLDIKNLTIDQAKEIYFRDYWNPHFEELTDPNIALQIFDFGVNAGVTRSIRIAQHNCQVHEDGILGHGTILAINNSPCFLERFKTARIKYYASITGGSKYLKGWTNRTLNTHL
jgi:lysozyme family protein